MGGVYVKRGWVALANGGKYVYVQRAPRLQTRSGSPAAITSQNGRQFAQNMGGVDNLNFETARIQLLMDFRTRRHQKTYVEGGRPPDDL